MGFLMRGKAPDELRKLLADESPSVRIAAAQALGQFGGEDGLNAVLPVLVKAIGEGSENFAVRLEALNAIDSLGTKTAPAVEKLRELSQAKPAKGAKGKGRKAKGGDSEGGGRTASYVPRLLEEILARFR